jgi:glucose/arabinose dehydrogenase
LALPITVKLRTLTAIIVTTLIAAGCGDSAKLPPNADFGANPHLPAPSISLIPTVNIAHAVGWPEGRTPQAAEGLNVAAFARALDHPRWLCVLPNGDVLVAESGAPSSPDEGGIGEWIQNWVMARAGAPARSANRISLLRNTGAGTSETPRPFLEGLKSPFGMALVGDSLYVANTDSVWRFPYVEGQTKITAPGIKIIDLPAHPIGHWTRNLIASRDGKLLYVTVGSSSNVAEGGLANEAGRASIWEVDPATGKHRIFASGLRNPNGMSWEPQTGALWTAVNERDELGSDLVPDYMTSVKDGGFYGWPYSYYGNHVDTRVNTPRPDLVANALVPDYALGNHTASLGLTFSEGAALPPPFGRGVFVGQHGSWNRKPRSGYKVIFIPFSEGKPAGSPIDVLTGFLSESGEALGRPVGVAIDKHGALLVADDVGNVVWRVTASSRKGL